MSSKSDIYSKNTHFEYPELTCIHGEPTTGYLITLKREINASATTIHTTLGGGHHGHLGLVTTPTTYQNIPNAQPYQHPPAPVPLNISPGAKKIQIAQAREQHAEENHLFERF